MYDVIIIGGGVSAFAAALYCGRFQLKTLVIGEMMGGTVVTTDDISNYPGYKRISGMELFDKIKEHAMDYPIEVKGEKVTEVKKKDCFLVKAEKEYKAHSIIFATGSEWRKLGVPGEKEYMNKGVHYCALCDGALYGGKVLGMVGGSDSAAKESLLLSKYAKKVYIIYRKQKIRAEPINAQMVEKNKKIEIIPNTNVTEIKGDKFVNSVLLDNPYKGLSELKLDGLFVNIGHIPLSSLAKGIGVELNEKGEIKVDMRTSSTNIRGAFACGDVVDSVFKQAITGAAEGVVAAYSAYQYVTKEMPVCGSSEDN